MKYLIGRLFRTYCVMKSGEKWYNTIKSVSDTLLNQNPEGESSSSLSYWPPKVDKYADKVWELEVSNHEKAQKGNWANADLFEIESVLLFLKCSI